MWRCNECGGEVIEKEIIEYALSKSKRHKKIYSKKHFYQCGDCDNHGNDIEDIAEWIKGEE